MGILCNHTAPVMSPICHVKGWRSYRVRVRCSWRDKNDILVFSPPTQTICYSRLPSSRNEEGLVALQFNKPDSVLLSEKDAVVKSLQSIVGTPGIQVMVESVRPLPDKL